MTGASFIRMTTDRIQATLQVEHPLHALKLADHARMLRERVLETSAIHRPKKLTEWGAEHLAGFIAFKANTPACGHWLLTEGSANVLAEQNLDGEGLIDLLSPPNATTTTNNNTTTTTATTATGIGISEMGIRKLAHMLGPIDSQLTDVAVAVKALCTLVVNVRDSEDGSAVGMCM